MTKQEKIVCAAVEFLAEHELSKKQFSYVMCGVNYRDIYRLAINIGCDPILNSKDGFITNRNRFVDAKEAYRIASSANQIKSMMILTDPPQYPDLKPEDLY